MARTAAANRWPPASPTAPSWAGASPRNPPGYPPTTSPADAAAFAIAMASCEVNGGTRLPVLGQDVREPGHVLRHPRGALPVAVERPARPLRRPAVTGEPGGERPLNGIQHRQEARADGAGVGAEVVLPVQPDVPYQPGGTGESAVAPRLMSRKCRRSRLLPLPPSPCTIITRDPGDSAGLPAADR
jgi:hypothetical protein